MKMRRQSLKEDDLRKNPKKPILTFKDVEKSWETLSGDDKVNVKRWIKDFEEMAVLCVV